MSTKPSESEIRDYFEGRVHAAERAMATRTGLNETLCREALEAAAAKLDAPTTASGRLAVVHYRERAGYGDPETGADGVIRIEYRIRPISDYAEDELSKRLGPDWRRQRPYSTHALEERYIKYGRPEPWNIHDVATSRQEALEMTLSPDSIPVDPAAVKLHTKMLSANAAAAEKKRREEEAQSAAVERGRKQRIAGDIWKQLASSPRTAPLTAAWNEYTTCNANDADVKSRLRNDPEAMRLYEDAVHGASVSSRTAGMKGFLRYAAEHRLYSASCPRPAVPVVKRVRGQVD